MKNTFNPKLLIFTLLALLLISFYHNLKYIKDAQEEDSVISENEFKTLGSYENSPKSLKMYYYLDKYSDEYNIPKHIAYNISYMETRYKGPYHWEYMSGLSSSQGALGPMQIMIGTARSINKESVPSSKLKNDIGYNVETSMKLLQKLYNKYKNWEIVCGAYNTGKPVINSYARFCANHKNYKENWIKL
jgi:soluble lytic murein transglycosylase-like protein